MSRFLALAFLAVFSTHCMTAATPSQPLECRIEPVADSPTSLRFTLTNPNAAPLWVLRWNTPLEGWKGTILTVNHNGTEIFLDTNVLGALHDLSAALGANDFTGIQNALGALDGAHDAIQNLIGDLGARSSRLEVTASNLAALDTQLRTFKSLVADVDMEKAVTELVSRQTAYEAAMLATSRVMGLTLADYLR